MNDPNPFDQKLRAQKGQIPEGVVGAAVFVVDTLDLSMAGAQAVFGEDAPPELAFEIYDRIVSRMVDDSKPKLGAR